MKQISYQSMNNQGVRETGCIQLENYQGRTVDGEKNDCVVRSIAIAMDVPYEVAYKICEKNGRAPKRGMYVDRDLMKNRRARTFKGYLFVKHKRKVSMTIPKFIKKNPTGRFICIKHGHAFNVIDGKVIGEILDNSRIIFYISVRKVEKKVDNITI